MCVIEMYAYSRNEQSDVKCRMYGLTRFELDKARLYIPRHFKIYRRNPNLIHTMCASRSVCFEENKYSRLYLVLIHYL